MLKTTERDDAVLLLTLAKSLCAEYFRGQFGVAAPHDNAGYLAKVENSWHDWIPQAQAVLNKALPITGSDDAKAKSAPLLHLYAQPQNHDDAYVVGTREGLIELRNAIDAAISGGSGVASVTVADGEGFSLHAVRRDTWDEMRLLNYPYTEQVGAGGLVNTWLVGGGVHPSELIGD